MIGVRKGRKKRKKKQLQLQIQRFKEFNKAHFTIQNVVFLAPYTELLDMPLQRGNLKEE